MSFTPPQSKTVGHNDLEVIHRDLPLLPLKGVDVVSVDVFDTAITRHLETPVDVFALVEERLAASLGLRAAGFAILRERAEKEVRQIAHEAGREEVTLAEIYGHLGEIRPDLYREAAFMQAEEIAAEEAVIQPVPDMLDFVRRARGMGHRVVFVSDMYLPQAVIERLLQRCGFDVGEGVLVSAETGRTKATGSQWSVLRDLVGAETCILHIGDDEWSDVRSPERHGIESWLYEPSRSERRHGGPLTPAILPFSRRSRAVRLACRERMTGKPIMSADDPNFRAGFMRRFGASWGAVVLGSFTRWLETRVQQHGLTHLLFCARDGWLPHRIWQAAGCEARTGIAGSYLYVSRRALCLAEAAMDADRGRLSKASLDRLASGELSLQTLLARSGLLHCQSLVAAAILEFGSLETIVTWPEGTERFRALLVSHRGEVLHALQPFLEAAEGYIHSEVPATGRVGFVDIGWHGTLQSSFVKLLDRRPMSPAVFGMYFGLWPRAQRLRSVTGWMEGCFTSDFRPIDEQAGLQNAVAILENLNLAPHGSTIGYRSVDGAWMPILQEYPVEFAHQRALIASFQDATLTAIREMFSDHGSGALGELDWRAGLAAIERVALCPTLEELLALGAIQHAIEFDHTRFSPLITRLKPGEAVPWPDATDWAIGNALAWQEAAREASDPAWSQAVLARASSVRDRLDERTARLFA
jgi:predicted HAD superfamily hydrolase